MPDTMNFPTLAEVEALDEFQALPYPKQVEARNNWYKAAMQRGELSQQPEEVQQEVGRLLQLRKPVSAQQQVSPVAQRLYARAEGVQAGDPQQIDWARAEIFNNNAHTAMLLLKPLNNLVHGLFERAGFIGEGSAGLVRTREEADALEYLKQQMVLQDPDLARKTNRAEIFGRMIGTLGEILAGRIVTGSMASAGTGIATTMHASAVKSLDPFIKGSMTRWLYGSVAREVAESGGDAAFLLGAQIANDHLREGIYEDLQGTAKVGRMALSFGEFFVEDMLAFGLASVGGKFLRAGGKVFTTGFGKRVPQEMTNEALQQYMRGLITGESIPPEQLANMPKAARERYFRFRTRFKWIDAGTSDLSEQNLMELTAAHRGYDIAPTEKGFTVWDMREDPTSPKSLGNFSDVESAYQRAFEADLDWQRDAMKRPGQGLHTVGTGDVELREVVTGRTLPGETVQKKQWAHLLTPEIRRGRVDPKKVEAVGKSFAHEVGVPRDVAQNLRIQQVGDYGRRVRQGRTRAGNTIFVPTAAPTRVTEERYVKRLLGDLREWGSEVGGKGARDWDVEGWFQSQYQQAQRATVGLSREWIRYTVESKMPPGTRITQGPQGVSLIAPGGQSRTYNSMAELGSDLYLRTHEADPVTVGQHLQRHFNLELRPPKKGEPGSHWTVRTRKGEVLEQGRDLEELLQKNPEWVPSAPIEEAPDLIIDYTGGVARYERTVARGPAEQVADLGRAYEDTAARYAERFVKKADDEGTEILASGMNQRFVVTSPKYGVRKEFKSLQAATNWVKKSRKTYVDLEDVALEKGARIYPFRGQYVIHTVDDKRYVFKTLAGAQAKLREMPQLSGFEKEISGVDQGLLHAAQKQGLNLPEGGDRPLWNDYDFQMAFERFAKADPEVKTTGKTYFGLGGRPPDAVFQRLAKDMGMPELYSKFYEPMEKAVTSYKGMSNNFDKVLDDIFKGVGERDAELLSELWEIPQAQWAERAREMGFELTANHRRALEQSKIFISEELGRLFGVDGYKILNNYLPHIRTWAHGVGKNEDLGKFGNDILQGILKTSKLPEDVHAFMTHFRTQDMLAMGTERNLKRLLRLYSHKGAKVLTMADQYKKSKGWLNTAAKDLDQVALKYGEEYLRDVMGMVSDSSRAGAERWGQKAGEAFYDFLQKRKIIPKSVRAKMQIRDMFSLMQALTVSATMSFKAWMPIRNMQQVWTMLAGRLGPGGGRLVLDAWDDVLKEGDEVARHLRTTGRLTGDVPVFGYRAEGLLGKINRRGMAIYKNSDDFNRVLTDRVVHRMMDDAAARLLRGSIDEKQFLDLSGLRRMDEGSQRLVIDTLREKGYTAAKDLYGDILTREVQVLYREGAGPAWFRNSQLGKMFGMFGQYPTYYVENVRRGLRNGTTMDKVAFFFQTAMYSAGLYGIFQETLGVDARSFLPWGQMFFTGGPYFDLMMNARKAFSGQWDAPTAEQLVRNTSRLFVPGHSAVSAMTDAVKLWQQGDTTEALLRFGAFPLAD